MSPTKPRRRATPKPRRKPAVKLSYGGARLALFAAKYMRQTKGRWAGKPLLFEPWQLREFGELMRTAPNRELVLYVDDFGPASWSLAELTVSAPTKWPLEKIERFVLETDLKGAVRVHDEFLLGLPRKNGKSTIASALLNYLLVADGEEGAEVYAAAASKQQARIVFEQAKLMVEASPRLSDLITVYRDSMYVKATESLFRVLAADAPKLEGLNVHGAILDELHAWARRELYDVLTTATGAREQPLIGAITTAGEDLDDGTIGAEVFLRGAKRDQAGEPIVKGGKVAVREDKEPSFYFSWHGVAKAKVENRAAWKEANPASWVTVAALEKQRRKPRPVAVFQRRYLDVWVRVAGSWLRAGALERCSVETLPVREGAELYAAVDIGITRDTASVVACAPYLKTVAGVERIMLPVFSRTWGVWRDLEKPMPVGFADHIVGEGEEAELSLELVENYVRDLGGIFDLRAVAYDRWGFLRSAQMLTNEGYPMVDFPQTSDRMAPASQMTATAIAEKRLQYLETNDVLVKHVYASVAKDTGRGWRLTKDPKVVKHPIDTAIGLVMVISEAELAMQEGEPGVSAVG